MLTLAAGSSTPRVAFTGFSSPGGVAVDAAGNLYVTDTDNRRVVKLAAGSGTRAVLPFTDLYAPEGVARWNTAGDLYVADYGNNRVMKLAEG